MLVLHYEIFTEMPFTFDLEDKIHEWTVICTECWCISGKTHMNFELIIFSIIVYFYEYATNAEVSDLNISYRISFTLFFSCAMMMTMMRMVQLLILLLNMGCHSQFGWQPSSHQNSLPPRLRTSMFSTKIKR